MGEGYGASCQGDTSGLHIQAKQGELWIRINTPEMLNAMGEYIWPCPAPFCFAALELKALFAGGLIGQYTCERLAQRWQRAPGWVRRVFASVRRDQGFMAEIERIYPKRLQPAKSSGFVYLITDGARTKIGYSAKPQTRLRALQTASASRLTLLCYVPGTQTNERRLHEELTDFRVSGEWFCLPGSEQSKLVLRFMEGHL